MHEWVWLVLAAFFVVQGVSTTYTLRSIMRLRRTQHRIANHVQAIEYQLLSIGAMRRPSPKESAIGEG